MRGKAVVTLTVVVGALWLGVAGAAAQPTLRVDDDRQQCPTAEFESIQLAVLAAPPGSRIQVCPGLYNESVTIPKTLELDGHGPDARHRTGDPTREAVLNYPGPIGFNVIAPAVQIERFTIKAAGVEGIGTYTSPLFSGYRIERNLYTLNTFGLYLNSNGAARSYVEHNAFNDNNLCDRLAPPPPCSAQGNGIYSDQGLENAEIEHNYFTLHESAGIVFTTTIGLIEDVRIAHNESRQDGSFAAIFNSQRVNVLHNRIYRHQGSGIFLGGGDRAMRIAYNHLFAGASSGIVVTFVGAGVNLDVLIDHNLIRGGGGNGISLNETNSNEVRFNRIEGKAANGIRLNDSDHNRVARNHAHRNGVDGIRVNDSGSVGNRFVRNVMFRNAEHDAHDNNRPGNVWIKNQCRTDSPPATICRR
jgi:parallel beta-helix repeat protein